MPALYGVSVSLDDASACALGPFLDAGDPGFERSPLIPIEVVANGALEAPRVLERLLQERIGWLGRTADGLVVGNDAGAWFEVEGAPVRIRGVLGTNRATDVIRDLLLGALLVALRFLGVHGLHAGAVSFGDRALLLIGDSGAGKSTTAMALVSTGCHFIGDDALLIRERDGDVELLPLWPSFRLTDQSLAAFGSLQLDRFKSEGSEKWRLNVDTAFPNRYLAHWLGPKSVLFLERSAEARSSLAEIAPVDAVGRLIAQSNALSLECHPNPRQHLDLLAQLVAVSHVTRLRLGTEWLTDPTGAATWLLERALNFSQSRAPRGEAP